MKTKGQEQWKTKRLLITPLSDEALRAKRDAETDEGLKAAWGEMLRAAEAEPDKRLWCVPWRISLRAGGEEIGSIGFHGAPQKGAVELGYGIDGPYRKNGYAQEAAAAALDWAFGQEDVYWVEAESEQENAASLRVLEKLAFKPIGMGQEGPRFEREKAASAWMSIYMCLGMSVGLCFGLNFDNMAIGMSMGLCVGVGVGLLLDSSDKKRRAALRAERRGIPAQSTEEDEG